MSPHSYTAFSDVTITCHIWQVFRCYKLKSFVQARPQLWRGNPPVPDAAQPSLSSSGQHLRGQALVPSHRCAGHVHTGAAPWQTPGADCTGWLCWSGTLLHLGDQALGPFLALPALLHMPLDRPDCALQATWA